MRQQHKHYYAIRAYADGWEIVHKRIDGSWVSCRYPFFNENWEYRVVPNEDGWLPWYGGECPVDGLTVVEVRYDNITSATGINCAQGLKWGENYHIGAYRVIKEADPYAELKAAAKDPTKQIKYTFPDGASDGWHDYDHDWSFQGLLSGYEIRNKPKKMKLLAYITPDDGYLTWGKEGVPMTPAWKRVPSEDKEIEVEE